jgi:hypothetical protein
MKRNILKRSRKLKGNKITESLRIKNKKKKSYYSEKFLGELGKYRQPSVHSPRLALK